MKKSIFAFAILILGLVRVQAQNPYAALGIEEQVLHYDDTHKEVFDNDTLKSIGYAIYSPSLGLMALYDLKDSQLVFKKLTRAKLQDG